MGRGVGGASVQGPVRNGRSRTGRGQLCILLSISQLFSMSYPAPHAVCLSASVFGFVSADSFSESESDSDTKDSTD